MAVVRLTALVCVQNQEAQLSLCLRRLSFCDEVVVVADRCTDRSQEIARRHGAVVVPGIFPLESQRRTAGLAAASGDWVLEVEPDELVDSALAWEIRATLKMRPEGDWFEVPIDNYVGDELVRQGWTGLLGAERAPRLYRPGAKRWKAQRLDDGAMVSGKPAGALKGALRRTVGEDIGAVVNRLNRLTALTGEDLVDADGQRGPVAGLAWGLGQFVRSYVARGGWREGRLGFLVALMAGLYPVLAHLRAREILEARGRALAAAREDVRRPAVVGLGAR